MFTLKKINPKSSVKMLNVKAKQIQMFKVILQFSD